MVEITKYKTFNGKEFYTECEALKYENTVLDTVRDYFDTVLQQFLKTAKDENVYFKRSEQIRFIINILPDIESAKEMFEIIKGILELD